MISNQAGALAVDSLQRLQGALSSTYHCYTFLTAATCPSTLTAALSDHLPHIDPSSWEQRLAWGGTYVNGQRVLCDMHLPVPARIEYYEPKPEAVLMWSQANSLPREHIIAEDEDLLAVFKPAGLSSLPTREQVRFNLRTLLEDYLRASSPHPSLHMPSRIDTSVCGLVLASKSAKMHKALQRLFEERRMRKIYRLEASSPVSWQELRVNKLIGKDFSHPILRKVYDSHDPRARTKEAHTIFRMLRHCGALDGVARTLIEAQPLTGRTHQIRVHAASAGIAITGDNFYGGAIAPELRLISFSLEFCHPLTGSALSLAVPDALTPVWAKT